MARGQKRDGENLAVMPSLIGGLDTKLPPNRIAPSRSPDLLNVEFEDGQVRKRGGFSPETAYHLPQSAVRNTGYRGEVSTSRGDEKVLHVPGAMYGGHRDVWEDISRFTVEFFFRPEGLDVDEHTGNGEAAGAGNPFSGAPFDLLVRPILSKGPHKKTVTDSWDYDANTQHYGPPSTGRGTAPWNRDAPYGESGEIIAPLSATLATGTTVEFTLAQPTTRTGTFTAFAIGLNTDAGDLSAAYTVTVVSSTLLRITIAASTVLSGIATLVAEPDIKTAGMPFCFWLGRDTTAADWRFRFSAHSHDSGTSELVLTTIQADTPVKAGRLYHVLGSVRDGEIGLAIGTWFDDANGGIGGFVYDNLVSAASAEMLGYSPSPIQVFDCPQEFIEKDGGIAVGQYRNTDWDASDFVTAGPGLDLGRSTSGGYFFNCKRAEGVIEDIACWSVSFLPGAGDRAFETFQRDSKLDIEVYAGQLMQYWSFDEEGPDYVQEVTGRGNHLYRSPRTPIFDESSGGKLGSSHWFDGRGSYMLADLFRNPNWRHTYYDDLETVWARGVYDSALKRGEPHGLQVEFWTDDGSSSFEQVIVEVHSVLRIAIRPDNRIAVYARDDTGQAGAGPTFAVIPNYSAPAVTSFKVKPGQRYSISAIATATELKVFVDGEQNNTTVVLPGANTKGWPLGGLTIGIGSKVFTSYSNDANGAVDEFTPRDDQVSTDSRSGFMGRIESVSVLLADPNPESYGVYRSPDLEAKLPGRQLYVVPNDAAARTGIDARDENDDLPAGSAGAAISAASHKQGGYKVRYVARSGSTAPTQNISDQPLKASMGGAEFLEASHCAYFIELGRWELGQRTEPDERSTNAVATEVEYRGPNGPVPDQNAGVEWQRTSIGDIYGCLGPLIKVCKEPDQMSEVDEITTGVPADSRKQAYMQHRYRPYETTGSLKLCPQWTAGVALSLNGKTPVSLLADWQAQRDRERFLIAGASRNIWWIRPAARQDSPFRDRSDYSAWLFGQRNEHIKFPSSSDKGVQLAGVLAFEFWVKPQQLDGYRVIACTGDFPVDGTFASDPEINFLIYTRNGRLSVAGDQTGVNRWLYQEADFSVAGNPSIQSELRCNEWNHVYVLMGSATAGSGVYVWINGTWVEMVSAGGATIQATAPLSPGAPLYVGGIPSPFCSVLLHAGRQEMQSWCGLVSEVRVTNAEDASRFPSDRSAPGDVPQLRYATDPSTVRLIRFDEQRSDVYVDQEGEDYGESRMKRNVLIGSVQDEGGALPWSHEVYRDRLYAANGRARPIELTFDGFEFAVPIRLNNMGRLAPEPFPFTDERTVKLYSPPIGDQSAQTVLSEGNYQVWCAFVDRDGRESNPTLLLEKQLTQEEFDVSADGTVSANTWRVSWTTEPEDEPPVGSLVTFELTNFNTSPIDPNGFYAGTYLGETSPGIWQAEFTNFTITHPNSVGSPGTASIKIHFQGLRLRDGAPISSEDQIVQRRFYFSASGGGLALQHEASRIEENLSRSAELYGGGLGRSVEPGLRGIAPRVRLLAAGSGVMFGANAQFDTNRPAGGSLLAWSTGDDPTSWPSSREAILDSKNGTPIISILAHLSRLYVMQRRSVFAVSLTGITRSTDPGAFIAPVNESVAPAGGAAVYNNLIFGAGLDGVFGFDGSSVRYVSAELEGEWPLLPSSDEDFVAMRGIYRPRSQQYWLSVRGEDESERLAFLPPLPGPVGPAGTDIEIGQVELQERIRGNRRIYVLHTSQGDEGSFGAWTRWNVPEHATMIRVQDDQSGDERILLGTTSGSILAYDPNSFIDAAKDVTRQPDDLCVLDNPGYINYSPTALPAAPLPPVEYELPDPAVTAVTLKSLTIGSGSFCTIGDGLRGALIAFSYTGVSGQGRNIVRRIERNTSTQVFWRDALPELPDSATLALIQFVVGGYDGYWTSGWLSPQGVGNSVYLKIRELMMEFREQDDLTYRDSSGHPVKLIVGNRCAIRTLNASSQELKVIRPIRPWTISDPVELHEVDQAIGYLEQPVGLNEQNWGRYARFLFFTGGIRTPWAVDSFSFVWTGAESPRGGSPQNQPVPNR